MSEKNSKGSEDCEERGSVGGWAPSQVGAQACRREEQTSFARATPGQHREEEHRQHHHQHSTETHCSCVPSQAPLHPADNHRENGHVGRAYTRRGRRTSSLEVCILAGVLRSTPRKKVTDGPTPCGIHSCQGEWYGHGRRRASAACLGHAWASRVSPDSLQALR